jgi:hypothetical protein
LLTTYNETTTVTTGVLKEAGTAYSSQASEYTPGFLVVSVLFIFLFFCVVLLCVLKNTEGAIKKGQSAETGNIGYTRKRKTKQKTQHNMCWKPLCTTNKAKRK